MIRVQVKNLSGVVNWQSEFKTAAEADAWKELNISQNAWGLPGTYTIEDIDIAAEIAAREALQADIAARATQLKTLLAKPPGVNYTAAEIQQILRAVIRLIVRD